MISFRWASASRIGTSHIRMATRKQDALKSFAIPSKEVFCGIVADGAGSAMFGGQGAAMICRMMASSLQEHFKISDAIPAEADVWEWIDSIRDKLADLSASREVKRQAFASTLVLLVKVKDQSLVVHIGDGAVVGRNSAGDWVALSLPENGEYASSTYFLTDDPSPKMRFVQTVEAFTAYAVFSDGIEDLALNQSEQLPHIPFFNSIIKPFDNLEGMGRTDQLSRALSDFLASERVCDKTDDDKSLILVVVK